MSSSGSTSATSPWCGASAGTSLPRSATSAKVTGNTGGKALNLTGLTTPINLNLTGNTASVSAGLTAATPTFLGTPDIITLGSGRTLIAAPLTAAGGIEEISNFSFGLDQLTLSGATSATLKAYDETIGGQHAIAITGASTTHGVILLNEPSSLTAKAFLGSHVGFSNGNAIVS